MNIDPKFTSPGRGQNPKPVVRYAGLLDTATTNGLRSISTTLIHLDLEREIAVVKATVTMDIEGVVKLYEGIGDASPANAGAVAKDAWIRMAETRAKSRALRDAINVGDCSIEGDVDEWDDAPAYVPQQRPPPRPPPATAPAPTPVAAATAPVAPSGSPEPTPIRPDVAAEAPPPEPAEDPALTELRHRYAEVVFDAETRGIRGPAQAPTNVAGLTRAIESLEGQIRRAIAAQATPRRSAR